MPLVDLPVSELFAYQGRSPRPTDFDAYWERSLAEMRAVDPRVELVPAAFQVPGAECFDLRFTGVRGVRIYAKYLRPANRTGCPAVLRFHGYSGSSDDWADKLSFVAAGFCVAALDCRGQGGKSEDKGGVKGNTFHGHIIRGLEDGPDRLLFRDIFLDTAQLAGIVMGFAEVDAARVCTSGGSQGGALSLACSSLEPRIFRTASAVPFLCDYRRVWEMDLDVAAYEELRSWFRWFDPRHLREEEFFHTLGYIDVANLTPRIRSEVMLGCGLMDTICPPSSQFAAYNRIMSPKRVLFYPDFGHEGLPGYSDEELEFLTRS
jgi:cephalosporin-C deacetylase